MRKLPPLAFGVNQNFLSSAYHSIPLGALPRDNPYAAAITALQTAPFQYCPIDFCRVIHVALKEIQGTASEISFANTTAATGKVVAKSDHLLSLDDLFDITLIVFLVCEPDGIPPLVHRFEPFIAGLELTAELEFSFTNISALVRHIEDLDFDAFMETARKASESAIEVEPLHILPRKP
jgi:hypothetical protein